MLIVLWGVVGALALLLNAIRRLAVLALEPLVDPRLELTGWHLALYVASVVLNGYAEGYRGFQRGFAPRTVARALHLARHPRALHVVLAPLYVMGLIHATRRRLIASWVLLVGIVGLVLLVRRLAQPWRGIIDAGVVVGLGWGVVVMVVQLVRGLAGRSMPVGPDVPGPPGRGRP